MTYLALGRVGVGRVGIAPAQYRVFEAPPELGRRPEDAGVDEAHQREVLEQVVLEREKLFHYFSINTFTI